MKFKWTQLGEIKSLENHWNLRYSIFRGSASPWKEKWRATVEIGDPVLFSGGTSLGTGDFDTKEQAQEAVENTIKQFCKEIVEVGK